MIEHQTNLSHVPLWNSTNPDSSFKIILNDVSGRVPVTRLEHWSKFPEVIQSSFFERPNQTMIFRGHRRYDWTLAPSLARFDETGIIKEKIATQQLSRFRKAIRGRTKDYALFDESLDDENDELWSIGQHHGLHTPLLDWTYSPFVALFFAFAEEDQSDELDNSYRAVYVLNKSFVQDEDLCPDIGILEPKKDDYGRLVSQAGLFTFSPYENTLEGKLTESFASDNFPDRTLIDAGRDKEGNDNDIEASIIARYICKIYIKNEDQRGCLKFLHRMNVHHASLFPDLMGASQFCNNATYDDVLQGREIKITASETLQLQETAEVKTLIKNIAPIEAVLDDSYSLSILNILLTYYPDAIDENKDRLRFLSQEIADIFAKSMMLVDWDKREALQAEMRNKARFILRKYNYPEKLRENVIDALVKLKTKEQEYE